MLVREGFGLATALVVVAALSFAIANGENTARVVAAAGNGFANLLRAATLR